MIMTPISDQADRPLETADRIVEEMPRLRRYARKLVGDADRADDLVHECLVRALDKKDSFRPGTNLRAWLFVILRNCLYDDHRRAKRRPLVHDEIEEEQLPRVSGGQELRVALDELDVAMRELDPDHQRILYLVAIEGRRYEDAADRLDIPVGTVRSRLSRAREQLRDALGGARP
jgi:RNA polymerase sigma-70 factor (ECF subfamily)